MLKISKNVNAVSLAVTYEFMQQLEKQLIGRI